MEQGNSAWSSKDTNCCRRIITYPACVRVCIHGLRFAAAAAVAVAHLSLAISKLRDKVSLSFSSEATADTRLVSRSRRRSCLALCRPFIVHEMGERTQIVVAAASESSRGAREIRRGILSKLLIDTVAVVFERPTVLVYTVVSAPKQGKMACPGQ